MNVFKKKKLINFLDNIENKQLIVWFLTLCSYVILFVLFHNSFVLLFGYFAFNPFTNFTVLLTSSSKVLYHNAFI